MTVVSKGLKAHDDARQFPDVASVAMALAPSYPVHCVRPKILKRSAERFITLFPGTVLYAVKCNPHPLVLDALYQGGLRHFDTASLPEIAQIAETYERAHCYFMHPVKARAVIRSAYSVYGVRVFVVDHMNELEKVIEACEGDDLTIVVRLDTPPVDGTFYHLAEKFGADVEEAAELIKAADARGLKTGLSFHVGSQCGDPKAYGRALEIVGQVIQDSGVTPVCIDVGGGFPVTYPNLAAPALEDFVDEVRAGIKALALPPTVEVLAEPGRALVAAGCSLLVQVQLRKDRRLYINDGIYGSLTEVHQAKLELPARLIRLQGTPSGETESYTLNGPTCDSLDVLPVRFTLPADVREGDWIEIDSIGAYSYALATHFNGFHPHTFVEVFDEPPEGPR
ncbi:MAG: type III PLP-dependent enzyme [Kiloniellales bacterium]|nr:type III PLP-dependent enzyme [Kiloniellales bacterium]